MILSYSVDKYLLVNFISICKYTLFMLFLLPLGYILNNYIFIVPLVIFIILLLHNKFGTMVIFVIIWNYIYKFYIGQGCVTNSDVIDYFLNGDIYVIIAFIIYFNKCRKTLAQNRIVRHIILWIALYIVGILSSITIAGALNPGAIFGTFLIFSNIYIFIMVLTVPKSVRYTNIIFNLVIAIAIVQLVVSILQVTELIPPPRSLTSEQDIQQFELFAGQDDAASGTLGTWMSNKTSWICTVLFIFIYALAMQKKDMKLALLSFIPLLQYGTIDSKTALGVSILALALLSLKFIYHRVMGIKRLLTMAITFLFMVAMYNVVDYYYLNTTMSGGGIEFVEETVGNTISIVRENPFAWGKISGIMYATEYALKNNIGSIVFGFGSTDYGNYLNSNISPVMTLNNSLNFSSYYLHVYLTSGLFGLVSVVGLMITMMRSIRSTKYSSTLGKSFSISGTVMIQATAVFFFIQGALSVLDLAFLMIFLIYALVLRHENETFFCHTNMEAKGDLTPST